jgi:hypothetical protein
MNTYICTLSFREWTRTVLNKAAITDWCAETGVTCTLREQWKPNQVDAIFASKTDAVLFVLAWHK